MGLRVTPSILYRTSLGNIDRQRQALSETQRKASSGLEINQPSDDPSGTASALLLRSSLSAIEQYLRTNTNAEARVAAAEAAIGEANNLLINARELALQGANEGVGAQGRLQIAREVESLFGSLLTTANAAHSGGYVFGGFANSAPPFEQSGSFVDAPPTSPTVGFVGDSNQIQVAIDANETVDITFDGSRIFKGDTTGDGNPDGGRVDVFAVLADLRNALVADDQTAITATLDEIDGAIDQLSAERTRVGASATRIENANERLQSREVNLAERLSNLQDADLAEVISDLVQQESALQAGLSATARLLQTNLVDFLG